MTPAAAVATTAGVVLALYAASAGCLVDRRTSEFECSDSSQCLDGRVCDRGFCISSECPGDCTSCDVLAKTCTILCTGPNQLECRNVNCPNGYSCDVQCTANNACGGIDCRGSMACTISCAGTNACGDITCGTAACAVSCMDTGACGTISCARSCKCDVDCQVGDSCMDNQCPDSDTCTVDGTPATTCSSARAGCTTC